MIGAPHFVPPARRTAVWRVALRECAGACLLLAVAAVPSGVAAGPVQLGDDKARPAMRAPPRDERDPVPARVPAAVATTAESDDEQEDAAAPSHARLLGDSTDPGQGGLDDALVELPPLGAEGADPHAEASRAAADAALAAHEAREQAGARRQAYGARPPSWIQQAATVNLADFPQHEDPSASSEHELQTLQWSLAERERMAAAERKRGSSSAGEGSEGSGSGAPLAIDAEQLGTLGVLLPSTWLPLLREHRDALLGTAISVLLLSWLVGWLAARRRARSSRRSRPSRRGSRRQHRHRHDPPAAPPPAAAAVEAPPP
ncbi:MAG: hypothetical protein HYZ20_06010, partial [Burkholderiales bacterium]|nr:hypothetical protein [Burkholderiales bacterium]